MTGTIMTCAVLAQMLVRPWSQTNVPLAERVANDFKEKPAGAAFVHYAVPPMSEIQRLPDVYPEDAKPGAPVGIVLAKDAKIKYNYTSDFLKPLFCSVLSAAAAWAVNGICEKKLPAQGLTSVVGILTGENLAALLGIISAVAVYVLSLLVTRTLEKEEVIMLPGGRKIAKILEKYKLLG